jgi:hypothetical protein
MTAHQCARRFGACLVFACACVYSARSQAQWEAVPDVRLIAEMNDNPSLNATTTPDLAVIDEATRMLADAAVRFRYSQPRAELTFEPRVRSDVYAEEEAQRLESTDVFLRSSGLHRGQTVRIGYTADIANERILGVEFLDTLPTDPGPDDPTAVITTPVGVNEKRTRFGVLPYIEIAMNSRSTLVLDGRIVDVDYSSDAILGRSDFLERGIGGEYRRTLRSQRGTFGVRVFATGYEADLNANTSDTRGVELSYAREVTELWSWNISGGTQRSDYALTSGGRRIRGTDDTPIFSVGVRKSAERSGMRAELMRRMAPDALGFIAPRDEVRVSWERAMSARLNGGLAVRAIDAEGSPTGGGGRRYGRLELDVDWQIRPTWSFVAGYAYSNVDEGFTLTESSDSNALTVGVRYRGRSQRPVGGTR